MVARPERIHSDDDGRGDMIHRHTTGHCITTRSIQRMLNRYLIAIDGVPTTVTPHDLRHYISVLDGSTRVPISVYDTSTVLKQLIVIVQ